MDSLWKKLHSQFSLSTEDKKESLLLMKEYEKRGYLQHLNRELLDLSPSIVCDFFYRLSLLHSFRSPVSRRRDSRWLSDMDMTCFQIHAASAGSASGNFFKAAMLLPALRTEAVQLAPFTLCEAEHPDRLLSHSKISPSLTHPLLNQLGFTADQQLQLFVEAAHLCGKVLGFDLSYYLSRNAEALFRRPEMFRWIELDKRQMYVPLDHMNYEAILTDENQKRIHGNIKRQVKELEMQHLSPEEINRQLRLQGFFTVPLNGEPKGEIPLFIVYDPEQQEAVFTASSEQTGVTAFRFYRNEADKILYNQPASDYFSRIFPLWQKKGFDFLYLDRVVNPYLESSAIDSINQESPDKGILENLIKISRETKKNTGLIASGSFDHMDRYLESGFTSLVDQEDPLRLDREYMERTVRLQKELQEFNSSRKIKSSLLTRISLAEYNSPSFNQKAHLEHFCCRFLNCGKARRKKFEMMGINDGSSGYTISLKEPRNLIWREDRAFLESYHTIEDIYQRHRQSLLKGCIKEYRITDHYAWWIIKAPSEILAAIISVENDEMISPPFLEIELSAYYEKKRVPTILEYDFQTASGNLVLSMSSNIEALHIPYRGYRLYSIR